MKESVRPIASRTELVARLKSRPGLSVRSYDNPNLVASRFPFRYERLDHPSLRRLRAKYRLDHVVARGKTDFERMVLLRSWVAGRWKHGVPRCRRHAALKAIGILDRAARGERFFCHHDATTFIQCCLAMGWQARYVGILTSGPFGHSVSEVWSNSYRKWVVMDVSYDLHYLRGGLPLNALELHNIWMAPTTVPWSETTFVHGRSGPNLRPLHTLLSFKLLDFYYSFGVCMGNDLSRHRGPANVWIDKPFLQIEDPRLPGLRRRPFPVCRFTSLPQDLYWVLHDTHLDFALGQADDTLRVQLTSLPPRFARYLVRTDQGAWRPRRARFAWRLHAGTNTLEAKVVNRCGVEGPVSSIAIASR